MTYRERVARLSKLDREAFENACEGVENALLKSPANIELVLADVPIQPVIRDLVLVNLGRCWLEGQPGHDDPRRVSSFLERCTDLFTHEWMVQELNAHEQLVQAASDPKIATPSNNGVPTNSGAAGDLDRKEFSLPPGYRFEKELPRSGMGLVLLVVNEKLNRREVLKTIKPSKISDSTLNQRFRAEAQKFCEINHPSIITVYCADEYEGWPYFTMEYLEGGSLAERIASRPISARQAAIYIANIARALHVLHTKAGIVHRDIKPANMMFALFPGEGERIKLGDFGLAKKALTSPIKPDQAGAPAALTAALTVFGTPGYIAPELLSEQFLPDGKTREAFYVAADIFALGASLYQCVTGRLPYQQTGAKTDLMGSVVNKYQAPSLIVSTIDPVFDAICERALNKNPLHRFESAEELAIALESWLASQKREPVTIAIPASSPPLATPPAWRTFFASYPMYAIPFFVVFGALILYSLAPGLDDAKGGKRKDPNQPQNPDPGTGAIPPHPMSPIVAKLCEKGWPEDAAKEVASLNGAWFATLEKQDNTAKLKGLYVETLGQLSDHSLPFDRLQHEPHLTSLLAVTDDPSGVLQDIELHNTTQRERLGMFARYPTRELASALTKSIRSNDRLILGLQSRGWIGAEIVLLGRGSTREGASEYQSWISDILQNHALSNSEKAAGYMAMVMIHGAYIREQFANDPEFRRKFISQTWPNFKEVVAARSLKLENILADPAVWNVLNKPGGEKLIHDFGLAPVVLLYGKDAYPKNIQQRVLDLLQTRNEMITKSLLNPKLQKKDAFYRLLKRNITTTTLAVAIDRVLSKGDAYLVELEKVANWSDDQLTHELKAVKDISVFEKIAPQGIYAHVGLKLLSGSAVYSDEWERLWYRSVRDVAIAVGQGYFEAGASAVENFDKGYFGVIQASESIKEMRRIRREMELKREVGDEDQEYFDSALGTSEDYVRALQEISSIPTLQSANKGNQLNPVLKFFRAQVGPSQVIGMRLPDLDCVEFWSNRYGTTVIRFKDNSRFSKDYPDIAFFFKTRADLVMGAKEESAPEIERAWHEMLSAWWLLNSNGFVPLSDH